MNPQPDGEHYEREARRKGIAQLREENARMTEALEWIVSQKRTRRADRHMRFERLVEAAKRGLGMSDTA